MYKTKNNFWFMNLTDIRKAQCIQLVVCEMPQWRISKLRWTERAVYEWIERATDE